MSFLAACAHRPQNCASHRRLDAALLLTRSPHHVSTKFAQNNSASPVPSVHLRCSFPRLALKKKTKRSRVLSQSRLTLRATAHCYSVRVSFFPPPHKSFFKKRANRRRREKLQRERLTFFTLQIHARARASLRSIFTARGALRMTFSCRGSFRCGGFSFSFYERGEDRSAREDL